MTILEVPFIESEMQNITAHPFVKENFSAVVADFNKAHSIFMNREIENSEDVIRSISRFKTDIFSSFVAGMLWALNPDGQCFNILFPSEKGVKVEEQSRIIIPV